MAACTARCDSPLLDTTVSVFPTSNAFYFYLFYTSQKPRLHCKRDKTLFIKSRIPCKYHSIIRHRPSSSLLARKLLFHFQVTSVVASAPFDFVCLCFFCNVVFCIKQCEIVLFSKNIHRVHLSNPLKGEASNSLALLLVLYACSLGRLGLRARSRRLNRLSITPGHLTDLAFCPTLPV